MAKSPPRTKRKLGVEARAELGHPRVCTACDEEKIVSESTYTPSNKGLRGFKTVCKVCENTTLSEQKPKEVNLDREATEDLITEMYLQGMAAKPDVTKLEEITKILSDTVLLEKDDEVSFRKFIKIVQPLVAGWMEPGQIHDDIIKGLLSPHRRRLIIATRYSAKSTLTAIYVAWRIFREPLLKVMVVSRGSKLAARMLRTVRQVFFANCPMLAHLVPNDDCLDNAEQFQVPESVQVTTGGATLTSLGITSNLPGFRSDLTIADDVEGPKDDTPEKVEALEEVLNELHMINPKGEKVMLGTYQSEYSVYAKLSDIEKDDEIVWELHRACMFEEDEIDGKKCYHSRWPGMFTDSDAMDWRKSVTERAWRLHAMLIADPGILNERPLKISNFILHDYPPQADTFPLTIDAGGVHRDEVNTWSAPKGDVWYGPGNVGQDLARYAQTILAVDPASGLAGRDAIGVAVLGITAAGFGVVRHLEGVRGTDKLGNIRRVAQLGAHFHCTNVIVEELADGLFGETLEGQFMLLNFPVMVEKVTTGGQQKGRRIIETLAPPLAAGRLIMLRKVASSDHGGEFVNQLVRISYDGRTGAKKDHDDIVDALAHAVGFAKASLVGDVADNAAEHHIAQMDNWRGLPLKYGGLGADAADVPRGTRSVSLTGTGFAGDGDSMGERLLEEDKVLTAYEHRLERLEETVRSDMRVGRAPERRVRVQIVRLKEVIKGLKELRVL